MNIKKTNKQKKPTGLKSVSYALFPERLGCSDGGDTRQLHSQNEWQKDSYSLVCRIVNFIRGSRNRKEEGYVLYKMLYSEMEYDFLVSSFLSLG